MCASAAARANQCRAAAAAAAEVRVRRCSWTGFRHVNREAREGDGAHALLCKGLSRNPACESEGARALSCKCRALGVDSAIGVSSRTSKDDWD